MRKVVFFDLEGPLSPQDNAYELMSLFPEGRKIFEVISRYDDLLTLKGREDYEPGDTLSLIIPFLILHGIKEKDIRELAEKAPLTPGAPELIGMLKERNWQIFVISTSYEQFASRICERLKIPSENLASTHFPLDEISRNLSPEELRFVREIERRITALTPHEDDLQIEKLLDHFFWREIPGSPLAEAMRKVKPVGGGRKVEALRRFLRRAGAEEREAVAVGDSITDFKMLKELRERGGLSVAFNANEYALPHAEIGVASASLLDLYPVLEAWAEGGREKVAEISSRLPKVQWLPEFPQEEALKLHLDARRALRREAAKLG